MRRPLISRLASRLARLLRARSGVAMTEFALSLPLLMTVGMWGTETVNFTLTNMRVSQLAMQIADNASRIGDQSVLADRKIYEADIDDLLQGASIQAGHLDLYTRGRVIISSLEVVPGTTATQFIHWQRCRGAKKSVSLYGGEGKGLDGSLAGMGPATALVSASPNDAIMFVEIFYDYEPLISNIFTGTNKTRTIHTIAAFNVRDDRDLTQIFQRDTLSLDIVQLCSVFNI